MDATTNRLPPVEQMLVDIPISLHDNTKRLVVAFASALAYKHVS